MVGGFDEHGHVARTCVFSELAQACGHAGLGLLARHLALVGFRFAAKNTHVRCSERCRQVDEPPRISQSLRPLLWIGDVQVCRTAYARNLQLAVANLALSPLNALRSKDGMHWQVQISFETTQFNGSESVLSGNLQHFFPLPGGAAEPRKCEGQPGGFSCTCN